MRQSKALSVLLRGPGWDTGQIASLFVGLANLVVQSLVFHGAVPQVVLAAYSSVVFAVAIILLFLGLRRTSFTIYAVALLTSFSDVSWTGSDFQRHSSSVADLRLGPLSVAMWYLLLAAALICLRKDLWHKASDRTYDSVMRELRPLAAIVLLAVLQGVMRMALSVNSLSDFAVDLFSVAFVFLFLYAVLGCLPWERIQWILKTALQLAVISVAVNAIVGARVDYGGQLFVPAPDITNYLPVVVIAIYGTRRGFCALFWLVYVSVVFGTGLIAPNGKLILVVLMSAAYLIIVDGQGRFSVKRLIPVLLSIVALLSFADATVDFLDDLDYKVLAYKYRQVFTVGKMAMDDPALFYSSSIGNLAAELNTVWTASAPVDRLAGRGFGGWYKDVTGYLTIADAMAYRDGINATGRFRQFHLPIIQVLSWSGLVGIAFYFAMVGKLWKRIREGSPGALLPLTILLFTLGFLKENQLMFSLGLGLAMTQAKVLAVEPRKVLEQAMVPDRPRFRHRAWKQILAFASQPSSTASLVTPPAADSPAIERIKNAPGLNHYSRI
jgi:hypothetical protein